MSKTRATEAMPPIPSHQCMTASNKAEWRNVLSDQSINRMEQRSQSINQSNDWMQFKMTNGNLTNQSTKQPTVRRHTCPLPLPPGQKHNPDQKRFLQWKQIPWNESRSIKAPNNRMESIHTWPIALLFPSNILQTVGPPLPSRPSSTLCLHHGLRKSRLRGRCHGPSGQTRSCLGRKFALIMAEWAPVVLVAGRCWLRLLLPCHHLIHSFEERICRWQIMSGYFSRKSTQQCYDWR